MANRKECLISDLCEVYGYFSD